MIALLKGIIESIDEDSMTVDVNGIGYLVSVPTRIISQFSIGDQVRLHIYTVVREDAINLYGFTYSQEREFFKLMLGVSGIGPKSALSLLSLLEPPALASAIMENNIALLSSAQGVGRKTAERLALELREKIQSALPEEYVPTPEEEVGEEVLEFLISLGAYFPDARKALKSVLEKGYSTSDFQQLLSLCLEELKPGKKK
ncbi:MAG: Holliday junction branch migration protein RuvA [Candidatus Eremiobacteraeota bacterium]|nr:Holliday junction branch migration protein RuvA [Candidatus Eremiobacteraeota bacterium]